jgi:transcriptional regulator of acetoin/glycerol metabolism
VTHYVDYFARRAAREPNTFTDDALSTLRRYTWPGNVRELKNLVEAVFAMAQSSEVGLDDLPRDFVDRLPAAAQNDEGERERLLAVLVEARWNKSRAARQLHCSRMTLYRRMTRLRMVSK